MHRLAYDLIASEQIRIANVKDEPIALEQVDHRVGRHRSLAFQQLIVDEAQILQLERLVVDGTRLVANDARLGAYLRQGWMRHQARLARHAYRAHGHFFRRKDLELYVNIQVAVAATGQRGRHLHMLQRDYVDYQRFLPCVKVERVVEDDVGLFEARGRHQLRLIHIEQVEVVVGENGGDRVERVVRGRVVLVVDVAGGAREPLLQADLVVCLELAGALGGQVHAD